MPEQLDMRSLNIGVLINVLTTTDPGGLPFDYCQIIDVERCRTRFARLVVAKADINQQANGTSKRTWQGKVEFQRLPGVRTAAHTADAGDRAVKQSIRERHAIGSPLQREIQVHAR